MPDGMCSPADEEDDRAARRANRVVDRVVQRRDVQKVNQEMKPGGVDEKENFRCYHVEGGATMIRIDVAEALVVGEGVEAPPRPKSAQWCVCVER